MSGSAAPRRALARAAWRLRLKKKRLRFMRTCLHGVETPYRFVESTLLTLRSLERTVAKEEIRYARLRARLLLTRSESAVPCALPPGSPGAPPMTATRMTRARTATTVAAAVIGTTAVIDTTTGTARA